MSNNKGYNVRAKTPFDPPTFPVRATKRTTEKKEKDKSTCQAKQQVSLGQASRCPPKKFWCRNTMCPFYRTTVFSLLLSLGKHNKHIERLQTFNARPTVLGILNHRGRINNNNGMPNNGTITVTVRKKTTLRRKKTFPLTGEKPFAVSYLSHTSLLVPETHVPD